MKIKLEASTRRVWINGEELLPGESQKVYNHSPDGFNWGYHGSGPAQLALAILLKYAPKHHQQYQAFKQDRVAMWPQGVDFETDIDLLEWAKERGYE